MKHHFKLLILLYLAVSTFSCKDRNPKDLTTSKQGSTTPGVPSKILSNETLDSIVQVIVDISAHDFYKNQKPEPVHFSNVQLKYIKKEDGEELYILCGEFITIDKKQTPFATVKNSDYEQWIGTSALTYCQDSDVLPYT
ncbi:MAG TPA: hypothetical protein PLP34_07675, partial [Chitinophagaceae bacterium]|nr:hypothetical protein [Chitinophagaceae bacterium]